MELLAPAGSFEQALASIESGCNALYGGLKNWSARSRAVNLSETEYCELINICNKRNISFYLTLNTLMSDKELKNIKNFFDQKDVLKPHGILVGDIGLMCMLKEYFPDITLHASTQFGAYSVRDVLFFESLGMKRVVLARELSIKEIENIKKNTSSELEVFVYGNQCVIFSGNCLWGGLTHSGSGHKGCCIGTCNDIFDNKAGRIGNFLWANNIGLYEWVNRLNDIGIDSIKIEGRVRSCDEVRCVVSKFYSAMQGEKIDNDYDYDGYLGGKLPPKGMFNDFNPENQYKNVEDIEFSNDDYLHTVKNGISSFVYGDEADTNEYVFTFFRNKWDRNRINIRIRFGFEIRDGIVEMISVEYVKVNGTKNMYMISEETVQGEKGFYSLRYIYAEMIQKLKANVYDCKSKIPALTNVLIDINKLYCIFDKINCDIDSIVNREPGEINVPKADRNDDLLFISDEKDIYNYAARGYKNYIYKIKTEKGLALCIEMEDSIDGIKVFYQLPYLDFNNRLENICDMLRGRNVVITRISQLALKEKYSFKEMYGDYMLNVWNSESAKWLKQNGITALIAHPELSMKQINQISAKSGMKMILIAASKIPFGYTRACFKEVGLCGCNCANSVLELHNTYKDKDVEIICDNEFGYRTVFDKDIYISKDTDSNHKKIFGMFGISNKDKENILCGNIGVYRDKEIIYTERYYET